MIKFVDLSREFKQLKNKLINDFIKVGLSGQYVNGKNLKKFEKIFSKFIGVKYCVGVSSWTDGAILVFKAMGLHKNTEVITTSNSFIASCGAIIASGLKPVLVDVDETYNTNLKIIKKSVSKRTKVIMPIYLYGRIPEDIFNIKKFCSQKKIFLIEDAAQAIGAKIKNRKAGSIGDVGIFSMHPLKNLGVYGDGGFITTNNAKIYNKLLLLRNHGLKNRDVADSWGYNARLSDLNAKFATTKLKYINKWNKRHFKIAQTYNKYLDSSIIKPRISNLKNSVFHNYVIRLKKRDELKKFLYKNGIETSIHYPIPIHQQKMLINNKIYLPNTEKFSKEMLSLPIYHSLKDKEIKYIIDKVNLFIKK